MRSFSLKSLGYLTVAMAAIQIGCAGESDQDVPGSAGHHSDSTGGKTSSAGSTGGSVTAAAGALNIAGQGAGGSGAVGSGTAGSGTAGSVATGGSPGTAGSSSGGGSSAGAAGAPNPGTIPWGKAEDPSAGCPVTGTLPEYAALMADGKLPDPFKKLDGTRIKDKSEWACRRAEIVKQLAKYIYGEKPIPAKGSVTGTVSTTSISVKVTEGSKTASFSVTVDMNGATAPAPAIITYGAGAPIPKGVAKISLTAIESTGGSGAKMGPFFDFYGSNHPAGYMVAQG